MAKTKSEGPMTRASQTPAHDGCQFCGGKVAGWIGDMRLCLAHFAEQLRWR